MYIDTKIPSCRGKTDAINIEERKKKYIYISRKQRNLGTTKLS